MSQAPKVTHSEEQQVALENKPKVLVIDDSRLVRVSLNKLLGQQFEIIEAEDGEAGWQQIQKYPDLHVVLTDAGMPKLDGFGLIERVRASANKRIAALPLIMITGAEEGQTAIRERAFNLGASDFIIKPFDKTQMVARVQSYIRQDHLQRDLDMTTQTLKEHSTIDPLTKLPNQAYLLERFEKEMSLAKRHNQELSLVSLRVDSIQEIGKKFGSDTSQQIMIWLVEQLTPLIRTEDCLTRSNEYELSLITPATDRMSAAYVCERLRNKIETTAYDRTVISLPLTISIGLLNVAKDKPDSAEKALFDVRYRLDQAQKMGGNRLLAQNVATPTESNKAAISKPAEKAVVEKTMVENAVVEKAMAQTPALELLPEEETPQELLSLEMLDMLKLGQSVLPLLKQINKALKLDINQQLDVIEKRLQEFKQ